MEKAEVREFLDTAIRQWRAQRDAAISDPAHRQMCIYYIDAIQGVRQGLIGSTLGEPKLTDRQLRGIRNLVEMHDARKESGESTYTSDLDINSLREILLED